MDSCVVAVFFDLNFNIFFFFKTHFGGFHITSMKTPWGERLLIVPPFHRLQAVRALCGSGTQLQTQALLHEKIQCLKQLGLKGKSARSRKLLFYVPLSLSRYCFTHFSFLLFLICLLRCLSCESTPSSQLVPDSAKHNQIEGSVQVGGLRSVSPNLTDSAVLWAPSQTACAGVISSLMWGGWGRWGPAPLHPRARGSLLGKRGLPPLGGDKLL